MNEAQLTQFNIPTDSKASATSFLRANVNVAHEFAKAFGFDETDDRIALRAAQMAAVAIFEEVDDIAAMIGPKLEGYRQYIKNTIAPVTVTTVEVAAEPAAEPTVESEVVAAEPEVVVEAAAEQTTEVVESEPAAEPTVEPEAPKKVSSGRRGRQAYAVTGKLTAYQKCVNWLSDNNITGTDNRSTLAMQLTAATGIPVGSCLVYISTAYKNGVLK